MASDEETRRVWAEAKREQERHFSPVINCVLIFLVNDSNSFFLLLASFAHASVGSRHYQAFMFEKYN